MKLRNITDRGLQLNAGFFGLSLVFLIITTMSKNDPVGKNWHPLAIAEFVIATIIFIIFSLKPRLDEKRKIDRDISNRARGTGQNN